MALGTALLVIFLLWLFVVSPGFRKLAAWLAILAVIGIAVVYVQNENDKKAWAAKREAETQRESARLQRENARWFVINPDAIELRQGAIGKSGYGSSYGAQSFTFKANVKNNAAQPVTALVIESTAYDCPTAASPVDECETVGHNSSQTEINIPTNEVRAIIFSFEMKNFPSTRGVLTWRTHVTSARN